MPLRWKTSGLVGSRRARRRASASAMGGEIGEGVQLHVLYVLCGQGDVDVLTPPPKEKGFSYHEAAGRSTEELISHFGIVIWKRSTH